jgi:hypothetical protein
MYLPQIFHHWVPSYYFHWCCRNSILQIICEPQKILQKNKNKNKTHSTCLCWGAGGWGFLEIEFRALYMLDKHCTTESHSQVLESIKCDKTATIKPAHRVSKNKQSTAGPVLTTPRVQKALCMAKAWPKMRGKFLVQLFPLMLMDSLEKPRKAHGKECKDWYWVPTGLGFRVPMHEGLRVEEAQRAVRFSPTSRSPS